MSLDVDRVDSEREARDVQHGVDRTPCGGLGREAGDVVVAGHVTGDGVRTRLGGQLLEAVRATRERDHVPPRRAQHADRGRADAGRGARHDGALDGCR